MGSFREIQNKKTEVFLFCVLLISYFTISFFHEPWFDEAQSWQIAKCASIREILFEIPHYEAHPPLWHLMLAIPAKLGMPYELSLSVMSGIATLASGWILLFYSPFPKLVRRLLPFHYFLFYQYGVVSRPYGYMGLVFLLLAICFPRRNEKPVLFTCLLACECLLSAYGIVLAGGIALAWVIEICGETQWHLLKREFWINKRIGCLVILLGFAMGLIYDISPREDTVIGFAKIGQKIFSCFLYTFFMALPDCTVLTIMKQEGILRYTVIGGMEQALGISFGIIMLVAIVLFSSKKNLKYFLFPYVFLACFAAYVYFATHHAGIFLFILLFWFWINYQDDQKGWLWLKIKNNLNMSEKDKNMVKKCGKGMGCILLAVPVLWTILSSVLDVQIPYYYSRETAKFLKQHQLDQYNILCEWSGSTLPAKSENLYDDMNTNVMKTAVTLAPYFDGNPFYNFNMGKMDQAYVKFRIPTEKENEETVKAWSNRGKPEVIVGMVNPELLRGEEPLQKSEYVVVYKMKPLQFGIWKGLRAFNLFSVNYVYVRKELAERHGLVELGESPIG